MIKPVFYCENLKFNYVCKQKIRKQKNQKWQQTK